MPLEARRYALSRRLQEASVRAHIRSVREENLLAAGRRITGRREEKYERANFFFLTPRTYNSRAPRAEKYAFFLRRVYLQIINFDYMRFSGYVPNQDVNSRDPR